MATGKVNATSVNVREQPDSNATVNAVLIKDTPVQIMVASEDDAWILISALVDGHTRIGWIQTQFVTIDGAVKPPGDVPAASGTVNPKFPGILFTALVPGGFYSADPDDLHVLRAIRTNNPGALNDSRWQHARPGYVGKTFADSAGNQTAIYSSPEYGVASWYTLLADRYNFQQSGGTFTLRQLARNYAGSGAPASAVATYINGWSRLAATPLSEGSTIRLSSDDEMLNLATAMFKHESRAIVKISNQQILFGIQKQRQNELPAPPRPT